MESSSDELDLQQITAAEGPGEDDGPETPVSWVRVRGDRLRALGAMQRALLSFRAVSPLVKYLLEDVPLAMGAKRAELRLHDPDGEIARVLTILKLLGNALTLNKDSDPLYALYAELPETALIGYDDERMFNILPGVEDIATAVMMPVLDGNRLLASYHLGFAETSQDCTPDELPLFDMLSQLLGAALLHALDNETTEKLTLVDPDTEVGNQRAFRRDMQREISWARRVGAPLSLLYICLDDLDELSADYGEVASNFLQRRVSQRLCSELRATDYMANLGRGQFAVLLPSCSEPHAHDIGERMRGDIEQMAIDDGRGAVLHATLSIGMLSWEPGRHPVESNERLSGQMETEAQNAMQAAQRAGGNRISVARLGLLML
jgi:diguanylate cyclase (GGDEF)-like protein